MMGASSDVFKTDEKYYSTGFHQTLQASNRRKPACTTTVRSAPIVAFFLYTTSAFPQSLRRCRATLQKRYTLDMAFFTQAHTLDIPSLN